ncbi:Com family DNA-binding transcriptional regulator [Thalassospira xiamenensis]|uniref:Com family DNA-binding transcriptional regulator n=1 Tax=Thalassospira xiamenensis TaxID=220697 RepID=UPI0009EDB908
MTESINSGTKKEQYREIRCKSCGRKLLEAFGRIFIRVKCTRCKTLNAIESHPADHL